MAHRSRRSNKILGIGGSSHDFCAALLVDGFLEVAIEDERLDRVRHGLQAWHNSPAARSAAYCLESLELQPTDVDAIYANEDLEAPYPLFDKVVKKVPHHLAHAASAFFPSPHERAAILVIDGHGGVVARSGETLELETISIGLGEGATIELDLMQSGTKRLTSGTWHYVASNSLGSFYKVITDSLGFGMRGQGKTMGLAPYGDNKALYSELSSFVSIASDGCFSFDPYSGIYDWLVDKLVTSHNHFKVRADLAAAAQRIFEETVVSLARQCHARTRLKTLCYGGGCALNGSANYRILQESPFEDIYIYPAAGDNGLAAGAAFIGYFRYHGGVRHNVLPQCIGATAYKGRRYSISDCERALGQYPVHYRLSNNLIEEVVERLSRHEVIGMLRGGSEIGPRALGNRSIIADPRSISLRDHININIKERESFRPLAPIVPIEHVSKFFDLDRPSPFMLLIAPVKPAYQRILEGVCHVDGTARLQTIDRECNPFLHGLLCRYGEISGLPILINTSFNGKGEPIVETPEDALHCFMRLPINSLVLEDFVIEKHTPWAGRPVLRERPEDSSI